ncbi:MAG: T9SS type A sorting domain-containing protein [Bacteroidia bacterium]
MKKLLVISILIGSYFNVKSQTYSAGTIFPGYFDINPDTLLNYVTYPYTNETYSINMFGNSQNDIEFTANGAVSSGGYSQYIKVTSLNPNVFISFGRWDSVFVTANSNWNVTKVAKPLNFGDPINPMNVVWDNTVLYLTDHSGSGGGIKNVNDWVGGDKYIGLKYLNGGSTGYGWIRVRCKTADSCYIKDVSYTTLSTGINEIKQTETLAYPNPANNGFYLKDINMSTFDIKNVSLKNSYGNEVRFVHEIQGNNVKINPDKSLPEGCYILQYVSGENRYSGKLIITSE